MSSEDKSPIRIDEGSKINVVNLQGDYKIGEKSDSSMVLSMPASFLAQSENFFVSTYRLAKDIKCQAELAEKGRMSYLWDVMIAIGGVLIGTWNIVPVSIGFVLILCGLFIGRGAHFSIVSSLKGSASALVRSLETIVSDPSEQEEEIKQKESLGIKPRKKNSVK